MASVSSGFVEHVGTEPSGSFLTERVNLAQFVAKSRNPHQPIIVAQPGKNQRFFNKSLISIFIPYLQIFC